MANPSFHNILERHFKMTQDYLLDLVYDLFNEESKLEVVSGYYELVQGNEITTKMRTKLVEWMIQLSDEIKLGYKTKQMAVMIIDIVLSKIKISKKYLQLLGITAIFISVKSEESFIYTLTHACEHCANAYSNDEVSAMEMEILKTLKWKLQYPTPGEIARRLVQLANPMLGLNLTKFFKKTDNFIDLAVSEFDVSRFSPTCIAVAAVMCSFEDSVGHIEKWRRIMIENFNLNFEAHVDVLYQNIIQKLTKFYPDYFSFPTEEQFLQVVQQTYMPINNGETNAIQHSQATLDTTHEMYNGGNVISQETYIDQGQMTHDQILESGSQFGTPVKQNQYNYGQFEGLISNEQQLNNGYNHNVLGQAQLQEESY